MKKLLLSLVAFFVASFSMNAQNIYMMGSGNGLSWESWPGMIIQPGSDGSYSIKIDNLTSFKMSTAEATGWDDFNAAAFGYNGDFGDAVFSTNGQTVTLAAYGENQDMPATGSYTITINKERTSMTVKANFPKPTEAPAVYIRGAMNGWGSPDAYKFTYDSTSDSYSWTGQINAGSEFKIADANWGTINYSTNGDITTFGTPINLTYNAGNSKFTETFNGTIIFKITGTKTATATFNKEGEVKLPDNMYVIGTINGGAWEPTNVAMMTGNGEGVYTIESVNLKENGGSTGFAITQGGADWTEINGLRYGPSVQDSAAPIGTLITDIATGDLSWHITPGTYKMVFDISVPSLMITSAGGDDVDPNPNPNPEIPTTIYVIGNGDGQTWDLPGTPVQGTDGVFNFTVTNGSTFKFSVKNTTEWDGDNGFNSGAYGTGNELFSAAVYPNGETLDLIPWGENQNLPWIGDYEITVNFNTMKISAKAVTAQPTSFDVYIRGGMNEWGTDPSWKLTYDSTNDVYTWTGSIVSGIEWKFGDSKWGTVNYGYGDLTPVSDPTSLTFGGTNIKLTEDFTGTLIFKVNTTINEATVQFLTEEIDDGVDSINDETSTAVYYNLQGQKVTNPEEGIYIKVVNGNAIKVMR